MNKISEYGSYLAYLLFGGLMYSLWKVEAPVWIPAIVAAIWVLQLIRAAYLSDALKKSVKSEV